MGLSQFGGAFYITGLRRGQLGGFESLGNSLLAFLKLLRERFGCGEFHLRFRDGLLGLGDRVGCLCEFGRAPLLGCFLPERLREFGGQILERGLRLFQSAERLLLGFACGLRLVFGQLAGGFILTFTGLLEAFGRFRRCRFHLGDERLGFFLNPLLGLGERFAPFGLPLAALRLGRGLRLCRCRGLGCLVEICLLLDQRIELL